MTNYAILEDDKDLSYERGDALTKSYTSESVTELYPATKRTCGFDVKYAESTRYPKSFGTDD